MRLRKHTSIYRSLSTSVFGLLICTIAAAQINKTRPPNPNITPPGPRAQQPAGGQHPPNNAGDVEGFVYWDANTITHKPAGTCGGLAVNVSVAGSPNSAIQLGNHFKYAGQVKAFLYGGKQAVYDVCIYAYDHLPVGPQLQAQLVITQPNAFSPIVAAQTTTISPITIINAQCNMLPPIVPSTVGDLTSHWGSCQNRAYDVNFALTPSAHLMGSGGVSGGMLSGSNTGGKDPGPVNSSARGMLAGGTNPAPQQSLLRGMVPGAKDPGPIGTPSSTKGTPGQLLPARSGAAKLTNADVIGLVKGGVPESAIINQIKSSNKQFDFSPTSCRAMEQAHVSSQVLDAMGDGSVRPCFTGGVRTGAGNGADDLNPQPYPPKGTLATPGSSANSVQLNPQPYPPKGTGTRATSASPLMSVADQTPATLKRATAFASHARLALGAKIKISGAGGQGLDPATTETIQSESLETHNAKTAVTRGAQVVRTSSPQIGSSHTLDSTDPASGGSGSDPAGGQPGGDPTGGQPGSVPPAGGTPVQPAGTPPTQVGGSGTSHLTMQQMVRAPQPISMCRFTTDPVIETVGGKAHGIILTPDPGSGNYPTNQYAIVGCNFGQTQGDVHIFGQFINNSSPVKLGIDSWSDSAILVTFNPSFQNEYDLKNITLVVARKDGKSVQLPGISFVATRASHSLASIPRSLVKLPTDYFDKNVFVSPLKPANLQLAGLAPVSQKGTSAFYLYDSIWTSNVGDGYPPNRLFFSDQIDFSKLRPGFTLDDNAQTLVLGTQSLSSGNGITVDSGGNCKYYDTVVNASMQGSTLAVGVQPAECDDSGKFIYAYYGLILSVTGPKGDKLNPWPDGLQ
jgi:hypothetical protein